jgi:hypothetical protein
MLRTGSSPIIVPLWGRSNRLACCRVAIAAEFRVLEFSQCLCFDRAEVCAKFAMQGGVKFAAVRAGAQRNLFNQRRSRKAF